MALGAEYRSRRAGKRGRRKLVLFSGYWDIIGEHYDEEPRDRRCWGMYAIPSDLFDLIDPRAINERIQAGYISHLLLRSGVPAKTAGRWPCKIGYRIVRLLIERGRIDYAVLSTPRDIKRATRMAPDSTRSVRIEAAQLFESIRAAGTRIDRHRRVARAR